MFSSHESNASKRVGDESIREVMSDLGRAGRRGRNMLIMQRLSLVGAVCLATVIALIAFDFAFRLPGVLRLVLLVCGLCVLGWTFWKVILPALAFRPGLTDVALRVERVMPSLSGRLASSVEFASAGVDATNPLAARAVRETVRRVEGGFGVVGGGSGSSSLAKAVTNPAGLRRDGAMFLGVVLVAAVCAALQPAIASTGLARLLLPLSDTRWPARTGVESMMANVLVNGVHARGEVMPVRARVVRGEPDQRVEARYRVRVEGTWQAWNRIVLTHQSGAGGIHERLVDTNAETMELYFATDDDQTAVESIMLVEPPAIRRASLQVTPPTYAAQRLGVYHAELGPGTDGRSITDAASLVGSRANLRLELNKALPVPAGLAAGNSSLANWLRDTFGWGEVDPSTEPAFVAEGLSGASAEASSSSTWLVSWTIDGTRTLALNLRDEYGLRNTDSIGYRIEAVADRQPSVTITQPASDETVLATAVVTLRAEARDDVGMASIGLEARVQSSGMTQEQALESTSSWSVQESSSAAEAVVVSEIELTPLHLNKGDVVLITAVAHDVRAEDGAGREPARSATRRLRVLDETEFATQIRRQLSAVRQNAIRIEAQQGELMDDVEDDGVQAGMSRAQGQIAERIATQRQSVDEIARQMRQNRLDDAQLQDVLRQTSDLLDFAGRSANRATEAIEQREGRPAAARTVEQQMAATAGERSDNTPRGDPRAASRNDQQQPGEQRAEQRGEQPQGSQPQGGQPGQQQGRQEQGQQQQQQQGEAQGQQGQQAQQAQQGQQGQQGERNQRGQQGEQAEQDAQRGDERAVEDREILEAQQEVRDELADLIKLLDRDEDTWVVKRQLEGISREQAELEQQTRALGEQTVGQRVEDLTDRQRSELDRIAQRQRELAQQARDLIEQMRDRAQGLAQVDPQAAESMRNAADTAEQNQLDRDMQQAAAQAQQNQMTSAGASQQNAQRTMQQMMQNMDRDQRAQAQQLLRQLASLMESIQRLINVQENELNALALAVDADNFSGLDRSLIRLSQNTQAVAQEARSAGQQTRRVARSLDRAADAQGAAVADLRAMPINAKGAEEAETRSLELLREAKELAESLQQQTEEEEIRRRREELIDQYRAFAERQVALRGEALDLEKAAAGDPLDRRQLVEARRIGSQQEELRQGLAGIRDTTREILDAPVFSHVHRLIDGWSAQVTERLQAGSVDVDVTDRQLMIADAIGRLIAAVEESFAPPPEFEDGQNQQQQQQGGDEQGQQQQQPLIPPAVQLKLLQGIQEQVYDLTKNLDGRSDLDDAQRRNRLRDLGQQQRELGELARQMLEALENARPPASTPVEPGAQDGDQQQEPQP